MYCSIIAVLSISFAFFTFSSAAASAGCLRQTGFPVTSPLHPTNSSVEASCIKFLESDNKTCTLQRISEHVQLYKTLNSTFTQSAAEDVFDAFSKSFNVSFNDVNGTFITDSEPPNVGFNSAKNETSPGAEYYPQLSGNSYGGKVFSRRCYTGVVKKNCFNAIPIGTALEACRPFIPDEITKEPADSDDETIRLDEVSPSTRTGSLVATATPADSGAIHLFGRAGWQSSLLIVTMVMTIMMKIENYFVAF